MRKKFILLLFVLIFSIKQEEVVFSEMETVSTKAEIIEPYDKGLKSMELLNPYYIEKGGFLDPRKVVFKATDENDKDIPLSEIRYKWLDNALDTSQEGNSAYANFFWIKDKNETFYISNIIVAYDLVLETKNSTLYQGEIWNPQDNFVKAYDEGSNPVYWSDDRIKTNDASVNTNSPGTYYKIYTLKGQNKEVSSSFTVTVKEDQTKVELKDTELYVGQKWDLRSVFKNVVDKDGNPIKPEEVNDVWIDGNKTREIDTSKPGKHTVKIAVENAKGDLVYSNEVTVTVEDKTSIKTKNSTIYAGQGWSKIDNFVSATDEVGQNVPFQDKRIRMEGATDVEPIKPAVYKVTYIFDRKFKQVKSESTVTVKEDQTNVELKDTELYVGQKWDLGSVFKNVVDKDGNPIKPEEVNDVWIDGKKKREIDTSKPGKHSVRIAILKANNEWALSKTVEVTVKEDKTNVELKDTELYVGQKWDLGSVFKNVVDKDGNPIKPEEVNDVWIDGKKKREIDTSKPGKHSVRIAILKANNEWALSKTVEVTVKEDKTNVELKDTELYVGQKWDLGSVFKNVVDKDGNPIKPEEVNDVWIDGNKKREIDTSKPGKHTVKIAILKANNEWALSKTVEVTVKEDKTKAELKDTELYVGQKWDLGSVFKNVVDKDGNPIKPEEVNDVWIDGNKKREIDTSKPGKHTVKIAILKANNEWALSKTVEVTVKEDKTKAELKDTELYVGQKWGLGSVFKYAIDKDGNPIKLEQVPWVDIDGKQIDLRENKTKELIDTNKPGTHTVSIAIRNAADVGHAYEWAHSNVVTVTVKEEPFTIKQVPYFDFEDHILVSTNKSVVNKKENPTIDLETPSINGKDWHLQVELSPFLDKKNSKSILKGVSLFIPKGKLESDLETEEPTQYDCQLEANGKASILMHGTKTKGKGRWKNKLETKGITLSIPSENKTGNYESTLHWTLLDVPG
ncbi:hypothetical protein GLO19_10860 [Enterococcus faecalis]|nr:hypothetical protein GLO19_10860 [Enterococcus faecalis]